MEKLYIISNESIFKENRNFFCDNIDIKSTTEGLNKTFEVHLFGRNSKKQRAHKINLNNIYISDNFFLFFYNIYKSLSRDNSKYLIISISPYTFLISILLTLFRKKPIVYLRSDGYGEYKAILGLLGKFIYHLMFVTVSNISSLVSCRKYILNGKPGKIVSPSQINSNWLKNIKEPNLDKIKLLYVGRLRKEKGIFSLINIIKKIKTELTLTIVGAEKDFDSSILPKNIKVFNVESDEKKLIEYYDNHNIFILPSYTEGLPMVVFEALSRFRPVIIFKEIEHIIKEKNGIYVSERNNEDLNDKINFIKKNYKNIQESMKANKLPTNVQFIKDMSSIINLER